jgi:hypothetical protein
MAGVSSAKTRFALLPGHGEGIASTPNHSPPQLICAFL